MFVLLAFGKQLCVTFERSVPLGVSRERGYKWSFRLLVIGDVVLTKNYFFISPQTMFVGGILFSCCPSVCDVMVQKGLGANSVKSYYTPCKTKF